MKNRLLQVVNCSIRDSNILNAKTSRGKFDRWIIFFDMIHKYLKYSIWTNQYSKYEINLLSGKQKIIICEELKTKNKIRDDWQKEFKNNRKFLNKFSSKKYELSKLRSKRNKMYQKKYKMGTNCFVEYDVEFSRQHYLNGSFTVGNNVLFAKHVFIDYSGIVEIGNNVQLTNGVIIETHHHSFHTTPQAPKEEIIQTALKISDGVVIGSRAIILSSCKYIGKNARVGAGAVVTKDIPDYATAVGVPAKVIKFNKL